MPRYIKQRDKFRCGPIAVMNALKWAGEEFSYLDLRDRLDKLCDCESPYGTHPDDLGRTLRKMGGKLFTVRTVYFPTLPQIEAHLRKGGAMVFNYYWRNEKKGRFNRHYIFLTGLSSSGNSIYLVNLGKKSLCRVTRETFKKDQLRFRQGDNSPVAWFLTERN